MKPWQKKNEILTTERMNLKKFMIVWCFLNVIFSTQNMETTFLLKIFRLDLMSDLFKVFYFSFSSHLLAECWGLIRKLKVSAFRELLLFVLLWMKFNSTYIISNKLRQQVLNHLNNNRKMNMRDLKELIIIIELNLSISFFLKLIVFLKKS